MSQRDNRRGSRAFAIPEMLLALIICGFAITVSVAAYMMLSQMWKESIVMNELSRNANVAIERMVHGRPANTGLVAARYISSPLSGASADNVSYNDAFDVSRSFYYSAGKIYADGAKLIVSDVGSVVFSNVDSKVRIGLTLHKYVKSKEIKLYVETQVGPRN